VNEENLFLNRVIRKYNLYLFRSDSSKISRDDPESRHSKIRDASLNAASMYLCKCDTERSLLSRSAMLRFASEERRRQVDRSR